MIAPLCLIYNNIRNSSDSCNQEISRDASKTINDTFLSPTL